MQSILQKLFHIEADNFQTYQSTCSMPCLLVERLPIQLERKVGTEKERNKQGEEIEQREIRGLGRLEAAYNYHFLYVKTFRCASAVAAAYNRALSISHQPESCTNARMLPLPPFL